MIRLKFKPVEFKNNKLIVIDQTKLPAKLEYIELKNVNAVCRAIKKLVVRGAPLLGIIAGYGVVVGLINKKFNSFESLYKEFKKIKEKIGKTRPTAYNLFYALDRMERCLITNKEKKSEEIIKILKREADNIYKEDLEISYKIGLNGSKLIKNGTRALTHCNAGGLATSGLGTALSVFFIAKTQNKKFEVFVDETRPLLQGARLTTWELMQWGIKTTLITDNMAGYTIKTRGINIIITGADRIALNGDTANKIGTYSLAVLAKYHKIPFYIAAPITTFDFSLRRGSEIPIEEREASELKKFNGKMIAPEKVNVFNPAFDITPGELITGIITEYGIIKPPYKKNIEELKRKINE